MHSVMHQICEAIRDRRRLIFEYNGHTRVVEPYCHGTNASGSELLRAIQVAGSSSSGTLGGSGKLWFVAKMTQIRTSDQTFVPGDPRYNPDDSAITVMHCRVPALPVRAGSFR